MPVTSRHADSQPTCSRRAKTQKGGPTLDYTERLQRLAINDENSAQATQMSSTRRRWRSSASPP